MMGSSRRKKLGFASTALAAVMLLGTPQASAQGLFGLIFGGGDRSERQRTYEPAPAPEPQRTRPASLPRVSGPSYYEYRTDRLVRVDFSAIQLPLEEARAPFEPTGLQIASSEGFDADLVESAERVGRDGETTARASSLPTIEDALPLPTEASETAAIEEDEVDRSAVLTPQEDAGEEAAIIQPTESSPGDGPAALGVDEGGAIEIVEEAGPDIPLLTQAKLEGLAEFELMAEEKAAQALVEYYSANPEFIWVVDGRPGEAAMQALDILAAADTHGLEVEHYRVSAPRRGASDADMARFEMELSARTLRYLRDVHGGRIDPNRISGYHDFEVKEIDYRAALETMAATDDVRGYLEGMHPQNDFYRALRTELEMLRVKEENDIVIDLQGLIRPGNTNAEFPKILELIARDADDAFLAEHGEVLDRHLGSDLYAEELVPVIRGAQAARNLQVDGIIGPQTVRGLAGESVAGRVQKVKLALERMRWLPSDLTSRFVFLNAPSFRAQYFEGGEERLNMRAIYGNTSRQTYFFKDRVSYVEFHPFWGVPRSILVNTYLERLIGDPGYLDRSGFEVTDRSGRRVASASIDWGQYGANIPYDVRQLPGSRNALGELKIMFPNRHAIYMHDTPDKHLFDRTNRAISNGCIRLDDPRAMAAAVLGWDRDDVANRLQGPHSREDLNVEVPVYVSYFTAFPEASGRVAYYDDVYNRDSRLTDAMARVDRARAPSS